MNYELGLLRNPDYKLNQAKCRTFFGSFLHPSVPGGYPATYADSIKHYADLDSLPRDAKLGVLDDLFLEETAQLLAEGFTNITLLAIEDTKTNKIPNICYMTMQMRLASVVYNKEEVTIKILKEDEVMKEHFDLCIMNPPFSVAPDVIKSGLEISDRVVCLAPLSKFKKNKVYQQVEKYEVIDAEAFEDAIVTDNLIIAALCKTHHNSISWDEFQIESTNPKYRELYQMNTEKSFYRSVIHTSIKGFEGIHPDTTFAVGIRVCQDGVHKTPFCFDYKWNKGELTEKDIPRQSWKGVETYSIQAIYFRTSEERDHFCKFWYENPLMNDLLKGLNKKSGSCTLAVPHIDYSVDRDYEHLTYEDLLKIMKEEKGNENHS